MSDIRVQDEGTIVLLHPLTDRGREWINTQVQADAQYLGRALAVERRYVQDILEGMAAEGLEIES